MGVQLGNPFPGAFFLFWEFGNWQRYSREFGAPGNNEMYGVMPLLPNGTMGNARSVL